MSKNKWLTKLNDDWGVIASQLAIKKPAVVATPSPSLNWATSVGGFTPGKITVLFGPESSGKSLLAMYSIVEVQRKDPEALSLWFDSEFSFNMPLFLKLGGDPDRLIIKKTNKPSEIFDFIGSDVLGKLQDGMPLKCLVIDSIKAIRYPVEQNKKSTEDQHMGGAGSKYLGGAIKLTLPVIAQYELLTFFVQQASSEIDPQKALRNPLVMTEGRALKHAADLLLEIVKLDTKAGVLEDGETISGAAQQVGHKVRIKVKKNRLGIPARMAQFTYHYDHGVIDTDEEIFELGKSLGLIYHPKNPETGKENNQMWKFSGYDPIRGEANMKTFVKSSKKVQDEIMVAAYGVKQDTKHQLDEHGVVIDDESTNFSLDEL